MLSAYKFLAFFWPFLKEMFLGDKTAKEALRHYKGRLIVICTILGSVFLNFFTIPRLVEISSQYVFLKKKHVEVSHELEKLKLTVAELSAAAQEATPATGAEQPRPEPTEEQTPKPFKPVKPPIHKPQAVEKTRQQSVREAFEKIERDESASN